MAFDRSAIRNPYLTVGGRAVAVRTLTDAQLVAALRDPANQNVLAPGWVRNGAGQVMRDPRAAPLPQQGSPNYQPPAPLPALPVPAGHIPATDGTSSPAPATSGYLRVYKNVGGRYRIVWMHRSRMTQQQLAAATASPLNRQGGGAPGGGGSLGDALAGGHGLGGGTLDVGNGDILDTATGPNPSSPPSHNPQPGYQWTFLNGEWVQTLINTDPRDADYVREAGNAAAERDRAIAEQEAERKQLKPMYDQGAAGIGKSYDRSRYDSNAELAGRGIVRSGEYQKRGTERVIQRASQTADLERQYGTGAQSRIASRIGDINNAYSLAEQNALRAAQERYSQRYIASPYAGSFS